MMLHRQRMSEHSAMPNSPESVFPYEHAFKTARADSAMPAPAEFSAAAGVVSVFSIFVIIAYSLPISFFTFVVFHDILYS